MGGVLWIGGPPGCGKTTVATRLARTYGLRLYSADTRTWAHRDRALAAGNPAARRWESLTPAQRWEDPAPAELLAMSLHAERGPMVLDDLLALPAAPLVLAEGSTLPAAAVPAGRVDRDRAVWLLPAAGFQRDRLADRGTTAGHTRLYLALTEVVEREAREAGVRTVTVDAGTDADAVTRAVERIFADALAAGPRARTRAERQALLRELNLAVVGQVRGYFARPWASGDPETVLRDFVCECGDPACTRTVRAAVARAATAPTLAHLPS